MDDIIINNLSYKEILNNFSINIKKESFVTIVGPNDCGKTTLLRILSNEKTIIDNNEIETIIPKEIEFETNNLSNELSIKGINIEKIDSNWDKRLINKKFSQMNEKEIILSQIIISLESSKKNIFLDDISSFFNKKERKKIWNTIKNIIKKKKKTFAYLSISLEDSLYYEYLYIMDKGSIVYQDEPLKLLQKDNVLNKIGLKLPFMVDLSVKLKDYDLIDSIELDINRMVEILWK